MSDTPRAEDFVQSVANLKFDDAFNPYSDNCPQFDRPHAAAIRRRNLQTILKAAQEQKVRSIWIARDLGYRGGRRTGLALTDEAHLCDHARLFGTASLSRATHGQPVAERTATTIWRTLLKIGKPVFLWNVFPLHPHEPGVPMSNRCHTRAERLACRHILDRLMGLLEPEFLLAIGRESQSALAELGINAAPIRHPSYGGQAEFVRDISVRYGIDMTLAQQVLSF